MNYTFSGTLWKKKKSFFEKSRNKIISLYKEKNGRGEGEGEINADKINVESLAN